MKYLKILTIFSLVFILSEESLRAEEYVTFSMKVAQKIISSGGRYSPEVFNLGGITVVRGLVCDRKTGDVILYQVAI